MKNMLRLGFFLIGDLLLVTGLLTLLLLNSQSTRAQIKVQATSTATIVAPTATSVATATPSATPDVMQTMTLQNIDKAHDLGQYVWTSVFPGDVTADVSKIIFRYSGDAGGNGISEAQKVFTALTKNADFLKNTDKFTYCIWQFQGGYSSTSTIEVDIYY